MDLLLLTPGYCTKARRWILQIDALAYDAAYANGRGASLNFNEWGTYTDCS